MTTDGFSESDLTAKGKAHQNGTQSRQVPMFMDRSNFGEMVENPFTKMASNPAKLDRCVRKVKAKGGAKNPWAVCNASIGSLLLFLLSSCGMFSRYANDFEIPADDTQKIVDQVALLPRYDINQDGVIDAQEFDTFATAFVFWVANTYAIQPPPPPEPEVTS